VRVLVVDDDRPVRELLEIISVRAGMIVEKASDGREALEKLRAGGFDLLMLDLMMPRASGYDVLQQLELEPSRPAIVVVTAAGDAQLTALNTGVVNYVIRKPFNVSMVTDVLNSLTAVSA